MSRRTRVSLAIGCLAIATLACSLDDILFPKTFYVTKTADTADGECSPDDCSLREAVIASNETAGRNEIVVPAGTYVLNATGAEDPSNPASVSDLDFTGGAVIHGEPSMTVIDASGAGRSFEISEKVRVEMSGLTIRSGYSERGGAIYNKGELTLTQSQITNNFASSDGGGIYNRGSLTLENVIVIANTSDGNGGGIANVLGTLIVDGSNSIYSNTAAENGGGIYNWNGRIEVAGMTLRQNAASYGGGIYNAGAMKLTGTQIISNQAGAGGGIYTVWSGAPDAAEASQVVVRDNSAHTGGGIHDENSILSLERSSIINNTASLYGGGLFLGPYGDSEIGCRDKSMLVNVTLSGNAAGEAAGWDGGAIFATCGASLTNVTIASNPAGGISGFGGGPSPSHLVQLKNVLLSDNEGSNCGGAAIDSQGNNLENTNTCGFVSSGDLVNTDPLLDSLQQISGTFVHPLLAGSPAIDAAGSGCPPTDQRGAPRPFGSACDIGAYEFGAPNLLPRIVSPTAGSSTPTTILSPTATPTATTPPPPPPSTWTYTLEPTDTPEPTATATTGFIIVTIAPLLPSSTPIP